MKDGAITPEEHEAVQEMMGRHTLSFLPADNVFTMGGLTFDAARCGEHARACDSAGDAYAASWWRGKADWLRKRA